MTKLVLLAPKKQINKYNKCGSSMNKEIILAMSTARVLLQYEVGVNFNIIKCLYIVWFLPIINMPVYVYTY